MWMGKVPAKGYITWVIDDETTAAATITQWTADTTPRGDGALRLGTWMVELTTKVGITGTAVCVAPKRNTRAAVDALRVTTARFGNAHVATRTRAKWIATGS